MIFSLSLNINKSKTDVKPSSNPDSNIVETSSNCECKDLPTRIKVSQISFFSCNGKQVKSYISWVFFRFHFRGVSSSLSAEQIIRISFDNISVILQGRMRLDITPARKYNFRSFEPTLKPPQFTCHWLFGAGEIILRAATAAAAWSYEAKMTLFCAAMCPPVHWALCTCGWAFCIYVFRYGISI